MKQAFLWMAVFLGSLSAAGCARITTQVVERPRVDQEVQGNRGFLVGSGPSPSSPRKATRQMIETNIELPTAGELNPWAKPKQGVGPTAAVVPAAPAIPSEGAEPSVPYAESEWEETIPPEPEIAPAGQMYTVERGDNLGKISAKFYGTSRKWRRIYEANRSSLRSPDRLYQGQRLVIPSLEESPQPSEPESEDFK